MAPNIFSTLSAFGPIGSIFNTLKEVDVRPARAAAETPFLLAFVSRDKPFADYLAALMYRGPRMQDIPPYRTSVALPMQAMDQIRRAQVVVIVTRPDTDNTDELRLVREFERANIATLVCFLTEMGSGPGAGAHASPSPQVNQQWMPASVVLAPLIDGTLDEAAALKQLVQAIRHVKAIDELALARHLPAFREAVVHALIEEVAMTNAVYSFGSGILQINPATGLPIVVADSIILTKNQAVMAYKIALAMGMQSDFKSVIPELAAVVGGGFIFRQVARQLIGLLPGLGILPKVAISFAGTLATGEVVYRWCATGEEVTASVAGRIYESALERGKDISRRLQERRSQGKANPSEDTTGTGQPATSQPSPDQPLASLPADLNATSALGAGVSASPVPQTNGAQP